MILKYCSLSKELIFLWLSKNSVTNQIFHYIAALRRNVQRVRGARHCARATQLLSKKCLSGGEPLATQRPIWPARDLNLRPPASKNWNWILSLNHSYLNVLQPSDDGLANLSIILQAEYKKLSDDDIREGDVDSYFSTLFQLSAELVSLCTKSRSRIRDEFWKVGFWMFAILPPHLHLATDHWDLYSVSP